MSAIRSSTLSTALPFPNSMAGFPFPPALSIEQALIWIDSVPSGTSAGAARDGVAARAAQRSTLRTWSQHVVERGSGTKWLVGTGDTGQPLWPQGFCGSFTYCGAWAGVALSKSEAVRSIGIDLEAVFSDQVAEEISIACLSDHERSVGRSLPYSTAEFATICFSIKEALYKAIYPIERTFLEFLDVEIVSVCPRSMTAQLRCDKGLARFVTDHLFAVTYQLRNGFVSSSALIERSSTLTQN